MLVAGLAVASAAALAWLLGAVLTADPMLPSARLGRYHSVMAVFPHPDDETVMCGGTLRRLATLGATVTLVVLTAGERGEPSQVSDEERRRLRAEELRRAAGLLGVARVLLEDFGDGRLAERSAAVAGYLGEVISRASPDLVLTFDRAGLDGHADHVACAEILIDMKRNKAMPATLWCAALPARLVRMLQAVRQMDRRQEVEQRRAAPTVKVFLGPAAIAKVRAWYSYASQRRSIVHGLGRLVPVWFAISFAQHEYFAEVG